jgi:hypothetical protein
MLAEHHNLCQWRDHHLQRDGGGGVGLRELEQPEPRHNKLRNDDDARNDESVHGNIHWKRRAYGYVQRGQAVDVYGCFVYAGLGRVGSGLVVHGDGFRYRFGVKVVPGRHGGVLVEW